MTNRLQYPDIDPSLLETLVPLAEELNALAELGRPCATEMAIFNRLARTDISRPLDFHFSGACSADHFVRDILASRHLADFDGLTDEEVALVVEWVATGTKPNETDFWLRVAERNLPNVPVSDMIFWPRDAESRVTRDPSAVGREFSPREIVALGRTTRETLGLARGSQPGDAQ